MVSKDISQKNLPSNRKHRLLIQMGSALGLRLSQLVSLKVTDINFSSRVIQLPKGKKRLPPLLLREIRSYLNLRPYESEFLFASQEGHAQVEKLIPYLRPYCTPVRSSVSPV